MQKKLIAIAIAGLASSAAFSQSNVTIYGRIDLGYVNYGGNSGGVTNISNTTRMDQGVAAGSRIGFKGAEDLGNGLKAIFEEEFGTYPDQPVATNSTTGFGKASAAGWTNRHAYLGLTGGFGTVVAGRLDGVRYGIFNKYDAFGGGTAGNFTQMTGQVDRADNAVAYISPDFSGFSVLLAYSGQVANGENNGNVNDGKLNTFNLNYNNGPISAALDYETVKTNKASSSANDNDTKVTTLAGSYDFGVVKVSALWDTHKNDNGAVGKNLDYRDWFIGVRAPIGAATLKAMYGRVQDKLTSSDDSRKWGIGADYNLSKRTQVFVDYGKITNDSGATRQISVAANGGTASGLGVHAFDFGIAHNF